jgi:hypothetical protein
MQGSFNTNPHVLKPYNIREASINISGINYPAQPIKFDFENNHIMEAYRFLLDNLGIGDSDVELDVTINQFINSFFILAFDISPTGDNGCVSHTPSEGSLSFKAELSKETPEPITLVVHSVFENKIIVNKNQQIHLDYTV